MAATTPKLRPTYNCPVWLAWAKDAPGKRAECLRYLLGMSSFRPPEGSDLGKMFGLATGTAQKVRQWAAKISGLPTWRDNRARMEKFLASVPPGQKVLTSEIAERFEVSFNCALDAIRRFGIETVKQPGKGFVEDVRQAIDELRAEGRPLTPRNVAKRSGRSQRLAYDVLRPMGVLRKYVRKGEGSAATSKD